MTEPLNQIIAECEGRLRIVGESFSNETIFNKILSDSTMYQIALFHCNFQKVNFIGSKFDNIVFRKCEF